MSETISAILNLLGSYDVKRIITTFGASGVAVFGTGKIILEWKDELNDPNLTQVKN